MVLIGPPPKPTTRLAQPLVRRHAVVVGVGGSLCRLISNYNESVVGVLTRQVECLPRCGGFTRHTGGDAEANVAHNLKSAMCPVYPGC